MFACKNAACALGSRKDEGLFTGGISAEFATMLTGDPEAPYGEGVCPNCGTPGEAVGKFESAAGDDPHADAHEAIAARVADPADDLDADGAQAALEALVGEEA